MNTIKLVLQGQIYGGTDGIAYRFPRMVGNEEDWTNTKSRLLNGRGDVRDTLNPKGRPKVFVISYLQNLGFVYAVTQQNKDDPRFGYADLLLLLGDSIPSDGKIMAETLSQLLDYFLSKEKKEENDFDKFVKDKLDELEKSLVVVSIKDNPFSVEENARIAYRIYSDDVALYKILRFPIQIGYKGYSRILIVSKENQPEQQSEVALVNEDVKRLISIECPTSSNVETDKKTVLEEDSFEIIYKKNGFVPKKQPIKAYASSTQLYVFDEKTNVITLKSYLELGKKEPFYKQVRFVIKMEGEAEPIKMRPRVFVNGGRLHHDKNNGEKVAKEGGEGVTYYYYELANGNCKITLDLDEPYGKVDFKLDTEANLKQGAENCVYEDDGRYAYTVTLQPKQKEVKLRVSFPGKGKEVSGSVHLKAGSELEEALSYYEKEKTLLGNIEEGGKKTSPWLLRILFLLLGIALGAVGMYFIPKLSDPKPAKVRTEMAQVFRGKEIKRADVEKYLDYADYYDQIVSDYPTFHAKVEDSLDALFEKNNAMKSLYKSLDSLNKMDGKACENLFNASIKGRTTIKLDDLCESVQTEIGKIDDRWYEEDKKLFADNAPSVKALAFKSSKGKQFVADLQNAKDWNAFKTALGSCPKLTEKDTIWGLLTSRLNGVNANSKTDSLVMKQFKEKEILFAEIADEVYLINTTDVWKKNELISEKYKNNFWEDLRNKDWARLSQRKEIFLNQKWKEFYGTVKNGSNNSRIDSTKDYFKLALKQPSSGGGGQNTYSGSGVDKK